MCDEFGTSDRAQRANAYRTTNLAACEVSVRLLPSRRAVCAVRCRRKHDNAIRFRMEVIKSHSPNRTCIACAAECDYMDNFS